MCLANIALGLSCIVTLRTACEADFVGTFFDVDDSFESLYPFFGVATSIDSNGYTM